MRISRPSARRTLELLKMPVLVLRGKRGVISAMLDPLTDWLELAVDARGRALDCGHFLPEEALVPVLRELRRLLRRNQRG